MKLFYVTLNNNDDAKKISHDLLKNCYAVCTNWFPINCAYRWEGEIKTSEEVVLIIKTRENYREEIEEIIARHINYTNFIAELDVHSINFAFQNWLGQEIIQKTLTVS